MPSYIPIQQSIVNLRLGSYVYISFCLQNYDIMVSSANATSSLVSALEGNIYTHLLLCEVLRYTCIIHLSFIQKILIPTSKPGRLRCGKTFDINNISAQLSRESLAPNGK